MDEIKFIRDSIEEQKLKDLQEVLDILNKKPEDSDVFAAKRFFYCLLLASRDFVKQKKEEEEKAKKLAEIDRKQPPGYKRIFTLEKPQFIQKITKPVFSPLKEQHLEPKLLHQASGDTKKPLSIPVPKPSNVVPKNKEKNNLSKDNILAHFIDQYPLIIAKNSKGEALAKIFLQDREGVPYYELKEPEIDFRLVEKTKELIQKEFIKNPKILDDDHFVTKKIKKAFKKLKIDYTDDYKDEVKYFLRNYLIGLGKIDPLLHDKNVSSIVCDGLNKPVKVSLGPGFEAITNIVFRKAEDLNSQLALLAYKTKQEISESNPIIDGTFYNFQIHATLGFGNVESKFIIERTLILP